MIVAGGRVFMVITFSRSGINRLVANPDRGQLNRKNVFVFFLSTFEPENLV